MSMEKFVRAFFGKYDGYTLAFSIGKYQIFYFYFYFPLIIFTSN